MALHYRNMTIGIDEKKVLLVAFYKVPLILCTYIFIEFVFDHMLEYGLHLMQIA